MDGYDDSSDTYSDEEEEALQRETRLRLASGELSVRKHNNYACPFCTGGKIRSWKLVDLLKHAEGKVGPEHRALADFILTDSTMASARTIAEVGDCGGNEEVRTRRDARREANKERRNEVLT